MGLGGWLKDTWRGGCDLGKKEDYYINQRVDKIDNAFRGIGNVLDFSRPQKYYRLNAKSLESRLKRAIKNSYIRREYLSTEQTGKYAEVLYGLEIRDDKLRGTYHLGRKRLGIGFLLGVAIKYLNTEEELKNEYKENLLKAIEADDLKPGEVVEKTDFNILRAIKTQVRDYSKDSLIVGIWYAEGGVVPWQMK